MQEHGSSDQPREPARCLRDSDRNYQYRVAPVPAVHQDRHRSLRSPNRPRAVRVTASDSQKRTPSKGSAWAAIRGQALAGSPKDLSTLSWCSLFAVLTSGPSGFRMWISTTPGSRARENSVEAVRRGVGLASRRHDLEQDRDDLERHEREIAAHESFNYAVLDATEPELLACLYIDPPADGNNYDAFVSWWVVDQCAGSQLDAELNEFAPCWVTTEWPFGNPRFGP